jgi:hypothetical protein
MVAKIATLALLLAFTVATESPSSEPFAYAGLSLATDWQELMARFPRSTHEFWESHSGNIHLLAVDGQAMFEQAVRSTPGKYRIRLADTESVTGVYFLEFDMTGGKIQAVKLSFERPEEFLKKPPVSMEERYPACGPILSSLTTQYGKPPKNRNWSEEALDQTRRTWLSASEQLALTCGQYMGRKKVFALELTIAR